MGQFLRRRYDKIIGTTYSPKNVYVRSTDVDRTLMTAQCVSAGLFPPSKEEIWNETLHIWQPIPIHTIPIDEDHFLIPLSKCPRHLNLFKKYLKSSEMTAILEKHKDLIDFLAKNSGKPIQSVIDIIYIFDTIYVENLKGFK